MFWSARELFKCYWNNWMNNKCIYSVDRTFQECHSRIPRRPHEIRSFVRCRALIHTFISSMNIWLLLRNLYSSKSENNIFIHSWIFSIYWRTRVAVFLHTYIHKYLRTRQLNDHERKTNDRNVYKAVAFMLSSFNLHKRVWESL